MTESITLSDAMLAKAEAILTEQRLHVALPDGPLVALVDGFTGVYQIRRGPHLFCTCPARGICAHLTALAMISAKPEAAA